MPAEPSPKRSQLRWPLTLAALLFATMTLSAATPEPDAGKWFAGGVNRAWLAPYDPTLIGRRIDSEFSFERKAGNISTTKIDTTVRDAWGVAKNLAVGLQLELPVKWVDTNGVLTSGLADLETRAGFVHRVLPTFRWGGGLNLKFPTASNPALRDAFELRPILAVSWDTTPWLNFGINAAYSLSPSPGADDAVNELELKFPIAVAFSSNWSGALTYKPTWHYESDSTTHKLECDLTWLFGDKQQFAISPGVEIPLSRQDLEWKILVDVAWYF